MRLFDRLDVQLALIFVMMLAAIITLTGWFHSGRLMIWRIPAEPEASAFLEKIKPDVASFAQALDGELDGRQVRDRLRTLRVSAENTTILQMLIDENYNVIAHTGGRMTFIELVRPDVEVDQFTVLTSLLRDHNNLTALYEEVPSLLVQSPEGNTYHLLAIPDPALREELQYQPIFLQGLLNHIDDFVWFYLAATILIVLFIRWRLRPLRQLAQLTAHLNVRRIPKPIAEPHNRDEVGGLVRTFNLATRRLDEDEKTRQQLISDISHELRTPLTSLAGRLEAFEDGLIDDKDELIAFASRKTALLNRIVEDMNLVSLADAGELVLEVQDVELSEFLSDHLSSEASQHPFEWQITGQVPPVPLDPWRFRQVLSNLVSNAARAKPKGLVISIFLTSSGGSVLLAFEDNGPGVAPEHLPHLFDRMYRTDKGRHSKAGGSGLGLSIVRSLIEAHGGTIRCSLAETGGLRHEIWLPNQRPSST